MYLVPCCSMPVARRDSSCNVFWKIEGQMSTKVRQAGAGGVSACKRYPVQVGCLSKEKSRHLGAVQDHALHGGHAGEHFFVLVFVLS